MTGKNRLQRGFTLLEMMVAMTILAVGMGAIIKASAGSAFNATILRDKEVARWVALNKLTEMQVLQEWSTKGQKGEVEMMKLVAMMVSANMPASAGADRIDNTI